MPRPRGNVPVIATDDLINDPGYTWDGTPTKVAIPDNQIAAGFLPGEAPAAQQLSWLFNRWGQFLEYLDSIEIQNVGSSASIAASGDFHGVAWDGFGRRLWAISDDGVNGIAHVSTEGRIWSVDTTLSAAAPIFGSLACNRADGVTVLVPHASHGAPDVYVRQATDAVPSFDPYTVSADKVLGIGCKWDPDTERFIIYGAKTPLIGPSSPHARLWVGTADGETWGEVTHPDYGAGTVFGACGLGPGTLKVATLLAASPKLLMPTDATLGTWTEATTLDFTPALIEYGATDGVLMAVDSTGDVYVSSDGVTWDWRVHLAGTYGTVVPYSLAVRGSIWLLLAKLGTGAENSILWSKDMGHTWSLINWPFTNGTHDVKACAALDDRFGMLTADGFIAYGLRLK